MAIELLSELKKACMAAPAPSSAATIGKGKLTRLRGRPVHAAEGTIALALSDDATLIINENAIERVERDEDKFAVDISADAHFALRIEKLFKATPCNCRGDGHTPPVASQEHPTGPNIDIEIGPIEVCEIVCGDVYINGFKFHVCVPVNCRIEKKA